MTDDRYTRAGDGFHADAEFTLSTPRLVLSPVDEPDLPGLLAVRESHPARLALTEGSAGEAGHYSLEMLERDVWIASLDPARALLTVRLRSSGAGAAGDADDAMQPPVVGLADLLASHPEDGHPWLGAIEIHRRHEGRGYAREAVAAIVDRLRSVVPDLPVRTAIDADDAIGESFARRCGFLVTQEVAASGGRIWELPPTAR